jgi:hypothetical protein
VRAVGGDFRKPAGPAETLLAGGSVKAAFSRAQGAFFEYGFGLNDEAV